MQCRVGARAGLLHLPFSMPMFDYLFYWKDAHPRRAFQARLLPLQRARFYITPKMKPSRNEASPSAHAGTGGLLHAWLSRQEEPAPKHPSVLPFPLHHTTSAHSPAQVTLTLQPQPSPRKSPRLRSFLAPATSARALCLEQQLVWRRGRV